MKASRHRIFAYLISFSLLVNFTIPAIALDTTVKTEQISEKPDSAEVKSFEKKVVSRHTPDVKKTERVTNNSSYNFIFYLVAMIVKAFSFSPQR